MRGNIVRYAKSYVRAKGIKLATLSRHVRGDMYFLDDYAAGKISVTTKKYDEIMQWFEDHWPENTPKPKIELHD